VIGGRGSNRTGSRRARGARHGRVAGAGWTRPGGPGSSPRSSGCTLAVKDAVRDHKRPTLDRHEDHAFLTWPSQRVARDMRRGRHRAQACASRPRDRRSRW